MPPRPAPDPRMGLFETLLVADGQPVALGEHLERLRTSLAAALGTALPESARDLALEASRGLALGRLRMTAALRGGEAPSPDRRPATLGTAALEAEAESIDPAIFLPAWERGARLSSFELPGGLGEHKWRDRSALPPEGEALPLLLDRGGEVLEAARANVFVVRDGAVFTPPLDGRVLPGTTRAAVLAIVAETGIDVHEGPLTLEDLLCAEEVFLTGSVRGVEPVRALDGVPLAHGPVAPLLARRLAERWRLPAPVPLTTSP